MKASSSRRVLATGVFVVAAIAGAVVREVSETGSLAYTLGTLFMVLWVPVAGNVIAYFIRRRRARIQAKAPPARRFEGPFEATMEVEIDLHHNPRSVRTTTLPSGEFHCLLATGTDAFSARVLLPEALRAGEPRTVEAQLLAPEVALPRFAAGTGFRVIAAKAVVGDGRVTALRAPRGAVDAA